jgi:hypothetical protein
MKTKYIMTLLFSIILLNGIYAATTDYDSINLVADTYNYSPVPVSPGEEFELWIQLTNNSNVLAENVTYILDLEYPFSVADFNNTEKTIAMLAPYQTTIIKYNLTTDIKAQDNIYEIEFKYKPGQSQVYNIENYSIDVSSGSTVLEITDTKLSEMSIGSDGELELTIKNLGAKTVRDVFVTLEDSTGDYISVLNLKTQYFENISAGQEIKAKYKLNVAKTITQNSYPLPLTLRFTGQSGEETITRDIGVKIDDNPKLVLNIVSIGTNNNNKIYIGNKEKIDLEIYNVGNIDAESVYAEMTSTITTETPKYFVGSIEKDNYDSVALEFNTNADIKPGSYPVEITIHYKDSALKEQEIKKGITVEILKNPKTKSVMSGIISIVIGILIGIIILALIILFLRWANKKILIPAFGGLYQNVFKKRK